MLKKLTLFSGYDWSIIEQVDDFSSLFGQDDLFLCTLDDCRGVQIVRFFELLSCDVGELCFSYQRLSFGADKLLF